MISIVVNSAVIFYTSKSLDDWLGPHLSPLEKFAIIVLIEHIMIALKLLLASMISDVPKWVI